MRVLLGQATGLKGPDLPAPTTVTQPPLRRNWHTVIPCVPAAASRTPRLLRTSEIQRTFAARRNRGYMIGLGLGFRVQGLGFRV